MVNFEEKRVRRVIVGPDVVGPPASGAISVGVLAGGMETCAFAIISSPCPATWIPLPTSVEPAPRGLDPNEIHRPALQLLAPIGTTENSVPSGSRPSSTLYDICDNGWGELGSSTITKATSSSSSGSKGGQKYSTICG